MSYSLEQLPDGRYRLEIDGAAVCFSGETFASIRDRVRAHASRDDSRQERERAKEMAERLAHFEDWKSLPWNSTFKYSIERGVVSHQAVGAIRCGLLDPNGTQYWSAYFSKIDWENDGHLFEPLLIRRYGADYTIDEFLERNGCNRTVSIFGYLNSKTIEEINKRAGSGTHLVDIGLTESRDYTPFNWACAKVYGREKKEPGLVVDQDFAKEHLQTFIDVLYDAAIFIYHNVSRKRSSCPGIEHWGTEAGIRASAKSVVFLSQYFSELQWKDICESEIWLLVKDVISTRKHKEAA